MKSQAINICEDAPERGDQSAEVERASHTRRDRRAEPAKDVISFDDVVVDTVADHVFGADADEFGDVPSSPSGYFAWRALRDAEAEAKLVEALRDQCALRAFAAGDDPGQVAGLQRAAQTAWIHHCHARATAAGAEGDPALARRAWRAVARARRAALALGRVAARAVTRAAIRARTAARARTIPPAQRQRVHRSVRLYARPRVPVRRRARAGPPIASTSAGGDEPGPASSRRDGAGRVQARRRM